MPKKVLIINNKVLTFKEDTKDVILYFENDVLTSAGEYLTDADDKYIEYAIK